MPDSDMVLVRRDDLRTLMDEDDGGSTSVSFFEPDVFARLLAAVNGEATTVEYGDRIRGSFIVMQMAGRYWRHVGPWTTQETP